MSVLRMDVGVCTSSQVTHQKPHQCDQTNHHYQANADGFGDPTIRRFSRNSDSSIAACRWSHVVADYENLRPIPVDDRLVAASARKCPQMMHHPVSSTQHTDYGGPRRNRERKSHPLCGVHICSQGIVSWVLFVKISGLTAERTNDRSSTPGDYHYFAQAVLAKDVPAAQSAFCKQNIFKAYRTLLWGLVSIFCCQCHYSVVKSADYWTLVFSNFCSQHKTFCPFKVCGGAGACTKLWHGVALPTHNPPKNLMHRTGVQLKLNKIIK